MSKVDLHIHTTASDGKYTPVEIVRKAHDAGLAYIAICDHDSIEAIQPAVIAAQSYPGLKILTGVEINTDIPAGELHILGYLFDYTDREFQNHMLILRESRIERTKKMIAKLRGIGLRIDFERVEQLSGGGSLGRPHIAQAMLEKGYINNFKEAFLKYIGRGGPAYIERDKVTPAEAVQLIRKAGGIPVLAHPLTTDNYIDLLPELLQAGLMGLEAYYNNYLPEQVQSVVAVAKKYNLITTGGSDYHGLDSLNELPLGSVDVPLDVVNRLMALKTDLGNRPL